MADNLYRIDDALIRAGFLFGVVALIGAANLPSASSFDPPMLKWIAVSAVLAAPMVMLVAGYAVRRRERQLIAIWRILKEHGEMPIADLQQMSGYGTDELRKAVGLLNRKLAAGLSWDEASRSVRHVGLEPRETLTHSQRCPSCGASVSVEVAADSRSEALTCPYCEGALDGREISSLQNQLRSRKTRSRAPQPVPIYLRAPAEPPARPPARRFSLVVFILLLMFFWPAAVFYAMHRANNSRTFG